jgi:hypothetical protein
MGLQPEQIEHINIVNWFNYQFPELKDDLHHFANERVCSVQQGRTLKRMGVKRGVADFFLALPLGGKSGLWLELKVGKNKPTKEQMDFLARKAARGYEALVVWGFDAAKAIILSYLSGMPTNSLELQPKMPVQD